MIGVVIVLGGVVGAAVVNWSLQTAVAVRKSLSSEPVRPTSFVRVTTLFLGTTVGGLTGLLLYQSNSLVDCSLLVVVSLLLLSQAPLDFLTRRLSRPVTVVGLSIAILIVTLDTLGSSAESHTLVTLTVSLVVVALFGVLHRLSATSLGFGDVILVAPLGLAVAQVSPQTTLVWLVVASVSGALHGAVGLVTRKMQVIPFGPYLLGAAWLVLALNVHDRYQ